MTSYESGILPISAPALSNRAKSANIFKDLHSASLISLGQLCDDGCTAILDRKQIQVVKDQHVVLKGRRNWMDGLWDIDLIRSLPCASLVLVRTIVLQLKMEAEYAREHKYSKSVWLNLLLNLMSLFSI